MKKIIFLTGTRADFGKIKSLVNCLQDDPAFEVHLFVTGMHLDEKYGYTVHEIEKCGFQNIHCFANSNAEGRMDKALAKTIEGFAEFIRKMNPDLIVVHGDRIETLAGAVTGALNNFLVAHIEGGELSGTIDEHIRHAVSKMSHIHFVANDEAQKRLIQMGEHPSNIFIIGSPDMDLLLSADLPTPDEVKAHYQIPFHEYAISLYHPVTTEFKDTKKHAQQYFSALEKSGFPYILIYPNNDQGAEFILEAMQALKGHPQFVVFPSLRFEYFLTLLRHAKFIIGNSSAGIREAHYYRVPTVNVGSRQNGRSKNSSILHATNDTESIIAAIEEIKNFPVSNDAQYPFGNGNSAALFHQTLKQPVFWQTPPQKIFSDL